MKNLIPILVLSACLSSSAVVGQPPDQYVARTDISDSGTVIAQAGDLISVLSDDGKVVTVDTGFGTNVRVPRKDTATMEEAIPVLDRLIKRKPQDVRLYSARANIWAARGDLTQAVIDATRAIELDGQKDAVLFVNRGAFYSATGNYDSAVADFIKATHLNPKLHAAFTSLANAWINQQKYDEAIEILTSLIRIDAENPSYYVQRGVALRYKQSWDPAIADFSKALELDPENLAALGSRGFVCYLKGDHRAAVRDFDAIIQLNPDDAMAHNNRGYNRHLSGDYRSALTDYRRAVELRPAYAVAWQNMAWLLATCPDDQVRDGKQALAAAKKACDQRQTPVAADIKALAAAYAESGDFQKAVEHQTKVIAMTAEESSKEAERQILAIYQASKPYRTSPSAPQNTQI